VASLLFAPALLILIARRRPGLIEAGRPAGIGVGWAERLVATRKAALRAGFAVACAVSVAAAFLVRFETDLEALGLRDSAVEKVQRTVEERFGRQGEPLFLVAHAADGARLAADFDAMERLGGALRSSGEIGAFSSPGLLIPPPSAQEAALRELSERKLPGRWDGERLAAALRLASRQEGLRTDSSVDDYARGVASALSQSGVVSLDDLARSGDRRLSYFFNPERRAIAAHLTSPGPSWEPASLKKIEDAVRALGSDFTLIGPRVIMNEIRTSILLESGLAIAISFIANIAIVWLHFRSRRRVCRVMLPVTAGVLLTVGAVGITGASFNFFNIAGIALIFGFGVDYGIYMMQAHMEAGGCSGAEAVKRIGGRTALCALTTGISCGSLVTTHYRGLASIGTVLCFGALFCFLAAVLLLPATIDPEPRLSGIGAAPPTEAGP
jgi:predicted RND superfamily exporter protein